MYVQARIREQEARAICNTYNKIIKQLQKERLSYDNEVTELEVSKWCSCSYYLYVQRIGYVEVALRRVRAMRNFVQGRFRCKRQGCRISNLFITFCEIIGYFRPKKTCH